MGVHSAKAVIGIAMKKKLGHAATRLALAIAVQTLDHPGDSGEATNTFWAGREAMAHALGYPVHEYDASDEGERATRAAHEAVKRAVRELIDAGVLERLTTGIGRQRSVYRLLVPPPPARRQPRSQPVEKSGIGGW